MEQNIKTNVLELIREGKIHPHSRAYFAVRFIATILVALLALGVSVFVVSFIFFSIHESGEQFLLGFGRQGLFTFLILFPWTSLVLDLVILLLLEWLLQGFKFGHRISLLMIFVYVFILSSIIGLLINFTPIHRTLLKLADRGELPLIGEVYESLHNSHTSQGVFKGSVSSINGNMIVITKNDLDLDGDEITRTITLPPNSPSLNIGDNVYILGSASGTSVEVVGIQKFPTGRNY